MRTFDFASRMLRGENPRHDMKQSLAICFLALAIPAAAQSQRVQPDCVIDFSFTAAGQTQGGLGTCGNNLAGVLQWTVWYKSTGFSALSLRVESAPDAAGVPGTWVAYAGTVVTPGVNPNTAITQASTQFTGFEPWVRVHLSSVTGSGRITGEIYGCRQPGCSGAVGTGGSPPGMCPQGPTLSLQFNLDGTNCGGMTASQVLNAEGDIILKSGTNPMLVASVNPAGESAGPGTGAIFDVNFNDIRPPSVSGAAGTLGGYVELDSVSGGDTTITTTGTGGAGGGVFLFAGPGGRPLAAGVNATGGPGGAVTLGTGTGADASAGATSDTGGKAGDFTVLLGRGGDASGGAANTGGNAGKYIVQLNRGGTGSTANGTDSDVRFLDGATVRWLVDKAGRMQIGSVVFSSLGAPVNASSYYCSDCTVTSSIDNTCAASGPGAWAQRINGSWKCEF